MAANDKAPDRSEGDVNVSPHRQAWLDECINDATRRLLEQDAGVFLHQALSTPCLDVLDSAEGAAITDLQGRRLLDFHGNSLHQAGYGNPAVIEAVVEQIRRLPFCPRRYTNRAAIDLGKMLTDLAPGDLDKLTLCPGGTEAVGIALKLARVATGRYKTVSWWDAFHGATLDAISVGGQAHFRRDIGPLLPGCIHVPPPGGYRNPLGSPEAAADYVEYVFETEGDIAAFIAEPVRCTSVVVPPVEYWQRVREVCDRHGALMIMDEIPTGLGVTGKLFACEHAGVIPDVICLGKGLGGGVWPQAGVVVRKHLDVTGHMSIGHYTHEKSPGGCGAALATLKFITENDLPARAAKLGAETLDKLEALKDKHPLIGDVRGVGLVMAVELVADQSTKAPANEAAERCMYECLRRGLSFKVSCGNVITLTPSLVITEDEMNQAVSILDESLTAVSKDM